MDSFSYFSKKSHLFSPSKCANKFGINHLFSIQTILSSLQLISNRVTIDQPALERGFAIFRGLQKISINYAIFRRLQKINTDT